MYSAIIIFYLALIGMIVMILLKRGEMRSGRASVVSRLGRGSDEMFHQMFATGKHAMSYLNKRSLIVFTQWVAFHVLLRIRNIYVEAKHRALENPHSRKVLDAVRGRGRISRHGASFYLRRISEK